MPNQSSGDGGREHPRVPTLLCPDDLGAFTTLFDPFATSVSPLMEPPCSCDRPSPQRVPSQEGGQLTAGGGCGTEPTDEEAWPPI
jgi:hypothetical protein